MDPLWWLIPAAIAAGFIDSMVGGGGVITLPAIIAAGLPPHAAIATNKVAGSGASGMATWQYARHRLLRPELLWLFPIAVVTSMAGAWTVLRLPERFVLNLIAVVIVAMVAYVLLRPRFGKDDHYTKPDAWTLLAAAGAVGLIAFYDGLLGPGTGSMLLFALVSIFGMRFVNAAAHGRMINFGSNLGALALFAFKDVIDWRIGLGMMAGTMAGAYVGSRTSIKHGDKWIKPLFVVMAAGLLVRLLMG